VWLNRLRSIKRIANRKKHEEAEEPTESDEFVRIVLVDAKWIPENVEWLIRALLDRLFGIQLIKVVEVNPLKELWSRVEELAKDGKFDEALKVAEEIENDDYRLYALGIVAKELAGACELERSKKMFREILRMAKTIEYEYHRSSALRGTARMIAEADLDIKDKIKLLNKAVEVARTIKDCEDRLFTLEWIAIELSKIGKLDKARKLFNESIQAIKLIEDDKNRSRALGWIISDLAKTDLREKDKVELFGKVIEAINTIRDRENLLEILEELVRRLAEVNLDKKDKVELFSRVVKVIETTRWDDDFVRLEFLSKIAVELAEIEGIEKAEELFNELVNKTIQIAERMDNDSLRSLMYVAVKLAEAGRLDKAIKIAENIVDADCQIKLNLSCSRALKDISVEFARFGVFDKAMKVAEMIEDDYYRSEALDEIVKMLAKADLDKESKVELFVRAIAVAGTIENGYYSIDVLEEVVEKIVETDLDEKDKVELLSRAVEVARTVEDDETRSSVFRAIAKGLAGLGELDKARELFNEAIQTAKLIEDCERSSALKQILWDLAEVNLNTKDKFDLLCGVIEVAGTIENDLYRSWVLEEILSMDLDKEIKAELFSKALEIIGKTDYVACSDTIMGILEEITEACLDKSVKVELFGKVVDIVKTIEDADDRSKILMEIVKGFVKIGEFGKAIEVAEIMEYNRYLSDAIYEILYRLAEADLNEEDKVKMLRDVIETAKKIKKEDDRSRILRRILDVLRDSMAKLVKGKDFDKINGILKTIEDGYYRSGVSGIVAKGLAEIGKLGKAKELFEMAIRTTKRIERSLDRSEILKLITEDLAETNLDKKDKVELFGKAIEVVETIEDDNYRSETLKVIVWNLIKTDLCKEDKAKLLGRVTEIVKKIENCKHRSEALEVIAIGYAKVGELDRAKELFDEAIQTAKMIEDNVDRLWAFTWIVLDLAESDLDKKDVVELLDKVIEIVETVEDVHYSRFCALRAIAKGLAKAGEQDKAKALFDEAIQTAKMLEDLFDRLDAIEMVQDLAEADLDRRDKAELFGKVIEIAETIEDDYHLSSAIEDIVENIVGSDLDEKDKISLLSKALEVSWKMEKYYYLDVDIPGIIEKELTKLIEARESDKAIEAVESIGDCHLRSRAFMRVTKELVKIGELDKAKKALSKAIQTAKTVEDDKSRLNALKEIVRDLAEIELDKKDKVELLDRAVEVAETIKDNVSRLNALRAIARELAELGEHDKAKELFNNAIRIAKTIEECEDRSQAVGGLACDIAEAKLDKKDKADLFREVVEAANTIENYRCLLDALDGIVEKLAEADLDKEDKAELIGKVIGVIETIEVNTYRSFALRKIAKRFESYGEIKKAIELYEKAGDTKKAEELRKPIK